MKTTLEKREDIINYYIERTHKLERNARNATTLRLMSKYLSLAQSNRKRTGEIADVINTDFSDSYYSKLHREIFEV